METMNATTPAPGTRFSWWGYEVEVTEDDKTPFILRGQRGAVYGAVRFPRSPDHVYFVRLEGGFGMVRVRGNGSLPVAAIRPEEV